MNSESLRRMVHLATRSGTDVVVPDAVLMDQYLRDRSEDSFRQMVDRHGPMVFGVCRRVLAHRQDAEDAYQATFLVLARKADVVSPRSALGRWLYGTAFRTALRLREQRRTQQLREQRVAESRPESTILPDSRDWLPLLDQELNALAERDRLPIVLCDLLGRSRHEAATELGISEGTLSSRLARARLRLRLRLEKRGVLPAIAAAPFVTSASLMASEGIPTPPVGLALLNELPRASLVAKGVLQAMWMESCVKWCAFTLMTAVVIAAGMWFGPKLGAELPKAPAADKKEKQPVPAEPENLDVEKREHAKLNGEWRVVSVEGKPQEPWVKPDLHYHFHNGNLTIYELRGKTRILQMEHVFTLEPALEPRGITLLGVRGWAEPFRPGIYRIKDDTLEVCWCVHSIGELELQDRPKGFAVPKQSKLTQLLVLKRVGDGKDLIPHERLRKLRLQRMEALRKVVEGLMDRFQAGRDPILPIVEASDRLMRAELELDHDAKSVQESLEDNLKRLKKLEQMTNQLYVQGKLTETDYLTVKARRLDVEILLEQAKIK